MTREGKEEELVLSEVSNVLLHGGSCSVGEEVAIAGFPLRHAYLLVQAGIVAATPILPIVGSEKEKEELIIDVMVNPGNSGGPVFLARNGKVVGVCTAHKLAPITTDLPEKQRLAQNAGLAVATPTKFLVDLLNKHNVPWEKGSHH